jgi:hypothetical protein
MTDQRDPRSRPTTVGEKRMSIWPIALVAALVVLGAYMLFGPNRQLSDAPRQSGAIEQNSPTNAPGTSPTLPPPKN